MADVFLSYKSERRAAAEHLAEILADYGYSVWWDYALLSGSDFGAQIEREIRAAKAVVVMWCSLSRESEWVKEEATLAKRLNKIIPARIEVVDLPLGFSMSHTLDLVDWDGAPHGRELDTLLREITRLVARTPAPNYDGLNRTERAWRRYGAPALREFALIDALERNRPARTLPSALRRPPNEGNGAEPSLQSHPVETSASQHSNTPPSYEAKVDEQSGTDRQSEPQSADSARAMLSTRITGVLLFSGMVLISLWAFWHNGATIKPPETVPPTGMIATTTPPGGATPTLSDRPGTTTPPPAVADTPEAPAPGAIVADAAPANVEWTICNKSSQEFVWVAIGYLGDAANASAQSSDKWLWTYEGWWKLARGECALIKRTMAKKFMVRAEAPKGVPHWGKDGKFCIHPRKYANFTVTVESRDACPPGYEDATSFEREATEFGPLPINLTD